MTRTQKQPWVNQANSAWDFKAEEWDVWPSRTGGDCSIKLKSLLQCNSHICTWGTKASQGQEPHTHPTAISKGCVCETHTKQLCIPPGSTRLAQTKPQEGKRALSHLGWGAGSKAAEAGYLGEFWLPVRPWTLIPVAASDLEVPAVTLWLR